MENEQLDDFLSALYIQSLRIYDILMLMAQKQGVDTDKLEKLHAEGKTLCPDPALMVDDEAQDNN